MREQDEVYIPVSCEFVDWVEHYATLKATIPIIYADDIGKLTLIHTKIKSWIIKDKVEYLLLPLTTKPIRLDRVISIGDKVLADFDTNCSIDR